MSESSLQFRVGLFVIVAATLAGGMVIRFGEMRWMWERYYTVAVNFDEAPGIQPGIPVRKNGISIGNVRSVFFEEEAGGVTVLLNIQERHVLRRDSQARLALSLLGDASIEFTPGHSQELLQDGAKLQGVIPADPLELVSRLESRMSATLDSFAETSREWTMVAQNVNSLMDTNRGNLDLVVERAAESLHHFTQTMQNANALFGDPENQANMKETIANLSQLTKDTRLTILAARSAMQKAEVNLDNLTAATAPIAERSESIVTKLDNSAGNLELLLAELNQFAQYLSDEDGSLRKLATDPALYQNLNRSASSLDVLLQNLEPVSEDLRVLSDKLARHPELLGVGGAFRGSTGLKTEEQPATTPPTRVGNKPSFFPGRK